MLTTTEIRASAGSVTGRAREGGDRRCCELQTFVLCQVGLYGGAWTRLLLVVRGRRLRQTSADARSRGLGARQTRRRARVGLRYSERLLQWTISVGVMVDDFPFAVFAAIDVGGTDVKAKGLTSHRRVQMLYAGGVRQVADDRNLQVGHLVASTFEGVRGALPGSADGVPPDLAPPQRMHRGNASIMRPHIGHGPRVAIQHAVQRCVEPIGRLPDFVLGGQGEPPFAGYHDEPTPRETGQSRRLSSDAGTRFAFHVEGGVLAEAVPAIARDEQQARVPGSAHYRNAR